MLYLSKPLAVLIPFLMEKEIYFYPWSAHSGIHYWVSVGTTRFPFCFEGAAKPENHSTIPPSNPPQQLPVLQGWQMLTADWDHNWLLLSIQFSFSKAICSIGLNLWRKLSATKSHFSDRKGVKNLYSTYTLCWDLHLQANSRMEVLPKDRHKTRKEFYQGSQLVTFSFHLNTSPNATALVIGDWAGAALVGYSVHMTQ